MYNPRSHQISHGVLAERDHRSLFMLSKGLGMLTLTVEHNYI